MRQNKVVGWFQNPQAPAILLAAGDFEKAGKWFKSKKEKGPWIVTGHSE